MSASRSPFKDPPTRDLRLRPRLAWCLVCSIGAHATAAALLVGAHPSSSDTTPPGVSVRPGEQSLSLTMVHPAPIAHEPSAARHAPNPRPDENPPHEPEPFPAGSASEPNAEPDHDSMASREPIEPAEPLSFSVRDAGRHVHVWAVEPVLRALDDARDGARTAARAMRNAVDVSSSDAPEARPMQARLEAHSADEPAAEPTRSETRSIRTRSAESRDNTTQAIDPPSTPSSASTGAVSAASVEGELSPRYPARSQRMGESGLVVLRVRVLASGKAGAVEVLRDAGHRRLVDAAIEAVREATFTPATRDGAAADAWLEVPVRFVLE
jgi:TonB family protein